jgi:hypothetical protein
MYLRSHEKALSLDDSQGCKHVRNAVVVAVAGYVWFTTNNVYYCTNCVWSFILAKSAEEIFVEKLQVEEAPLKLLIKSGLVG